MSCVYVTGHRNPDTDSIASAVGYAELKVTPEVKRLKVEVQPLRPEFRPGDTVRDCERVVRSR